MLRGLDSEKVKFNLKNWKWNDTNQIIRHLKMKAIARAKNFIKVSRLNKGKINDVKIQRT